MNRLNLILGIALFVSGCGSNSDSIPVPSENIGLLPDQRIAISGESRNYHLYLPERPADAPIVLLLHGNGGSSDQLLGRTIANAPFELWLDIALRENLILLAPDGLLGSNDKQGWNDCRNDAPTNPAADDVLFIRELISFTQQNYGSPESDVYSAGISNGALMAMRLADEMPDMFSAFAIVVASRPVNSECADSDIPLPVLIMNGTSDPLVPYEGGQIASNRGEVYSTAETVQYWINRNQTNTVPTETVFEDRDPNDNSQVIGYTYTNVDTNNTVEHYEVTNGGHTEPSIAQRYSELFKLVVGNQNGDIEMADEIWKFFSAH